MSLLILLSITCKCYAQLDSAGHNIQQSFANNIKTTDQLTDKLSFTDSSSRKIQAPAQSLTASTTNVLQYNNAVNKKTAKADSTAKALQNIPAKYIKDVDNKMGTYTQRMDKQTEKTLARLSKWENKLQPLIEQANPQAAQKLFGNGQMTFTTLLQKYKDGESIGSNYQAQYNAYNDKVSTQLKYLEQQKGKLDSSLIKPVSDANQKADQLNEDEKNNAAIQAFIKDRRKQLKDQALQYIGNSPYLAKMDKESFYYVETMKNYKQIYSDPQKAEETAEGIISKIPAYQSFVLRNSQLASMFGLSSMGNDSGNDEGIDTAALVPLQSKGDIQNDIQDKISSGGSNGQQVLSQSMQMAQTQLAQLKTQLGIPGSNAGDNSATPDFNPNMQKTKTLLQRLEFGTDIQTVRSTAYFPVTTTLGFSIGYKISDKSIIGIGASLDMGWGQDISHINITSQGIGARSFINIKLKGSIWVTGGFEMNYKTELNDIKVLQNYSAWQKSGLIGLTKKYKVGKKTGNIQLLWDFLSYDQVPRTTPIIFRTGYNF